MTAAEEISTNNHINILQDFQEFLRNLWKSDSTRPSIYSTEQSRVNWDFYQVEHRK